jgi:hypothetical protein
MPITRLLLKEVTALRSGDKTASKKISL